MSDASMLERLTDAVERYRYMRGAREWHVLDFGAPDLVPPEVGRFADIDQAGACARRLNVLNVLQELRNPTPEMLRAWVVAKLGADADPDEMVPIPGTGQGDHAVWPRWRSIAQAFDLELRWRASVDAITPKEPHTDE